jgi:hypothetical protein
MTFNSGLCRQIEIALLQGRLETLEESHCRRDPHAQAYQDLTAQEPLVMLQFARPQQPIASIQTTSRSIKQDGLQVGSMGQQSFTGGATETTNLNLPHCVQEPSDLSSIEGRSNTPPAVCETSSKGTPESCVSKIEPQWHGNPEFSHSPQGPGVTYEIMCHDDISPYFILQTSISILKNAPLYTTHLTYLPPQGVLETAPLPRGKGCSSLY